MTRKTKKIIPTILIVGILLLNYIFLCGFMPRENEFDLSGDISLLASFSTDYEGSIPSRINNIKIASKSINNVVLFPNESFSFNYHLGQRTIDKGYQTAKIIIGNQYVDGVGGGICQVSTTLYNAVLLSNLKILEANPHSLKANYVLPSFDAMVSFGSSDLKFYNDTNSIILIKAYATDSKISISVFGKKLEDGVKIKRVSHVVGRISPKEDVVLDKHLEESELLPNQEIVYEYVVFPKEGLISESYLETYKNGKRLSRKKLRKDVYSPVQGIKQCKIQEIESLEEKEELPFPQMRNPLNLF